jgi:hypothetical protein
VTEFHPARMHVDLDSIRDAVEPVEGELLLPADPHALTRTEYPWGVAVVCACGQWECIVTGPCSADWARRDHERHRTLAG